jgi:hypothetical protein
MACLFAHLTGKGSRSFVVIFGLFSQSCALLDSEERTLSAGKIPGRIFETTLDDENLNAQGARIVYRFKSVPGLVFAKNYPSGGNFQLLRESSALASAMNLARKKEYNLHQAAKEKNLNESGKGFEYLNSFQEARFDLAESELLKVGIELAPVRVAIIDSGVVPVSQPLWSALKWKTNLTHDLSYKNWQSHATAIGSVFSGIENEEKLLENNYAKNAHLHSIKISFNGDPEGTAREDFGALQLAIALDNAVSAGAKIVNLSFTYREEIPEEIRLAERYIIASAAEKGVVFVAAAGNAGENLDKKGVYPPRYDLDNLIVIGSHSTNGEKASSSSFGNSVHLTAPGASLILSSKNGGNAYFSGTSFATPIVASALSLYFGILPQSEYRTALSDLFANTESPASCDCENFPSSRYGKLNTQKVLRAAIKRRGIELQLPLHRQSNPMESKVSE